jgi:hypothetical protein
VDVSATGYYFDEVTNSVSGGPITLHAYSDLSTTSVLNVNLLSTLAYQRIQKLVTTSGKSFTDAQTQAESEVLAALNVQHGASYGPFTTLDISQNADAPRSTIPWPIPGLQGRIWSRHTRCRR